MSVHYFISDVHLGIGNAGAEERFQQFLLSIRDRAEALYILGDLFDFWFEYRRVVPRISLEVLTRLARLAETGTRVYLLRGNHDVWFKGWLERGLKLEGVFDELVVRIGDRRCYLTHGDALDRGFVPRIFRGLMRRGCAAALFSLLHPDLGIGLARRVAGFSRQRMEQRGDAVRVQRVLRDFARRKVAEGYQLVILGHSHIPEFVRFNGSGVYINTGDWLRNFTYAVLGEGEPELRRFPAVEEKG